LQPSLLAVRFYLQFEERWKGALGFQKKQYWIKNTMNIQSKYFPLLFIFILNNFVSNAQNWLWAKGEGRPYQDHAYTLDVNKDIFIGGFTSIASNTQNIYLSKYDLSGDKKWNLVIGGNTEPQDLTGIKADIDGKSVYICGYYSNSILIDSNFVQGVIGNTDLFFAKLDSSGDVQWIKTAGGDSIDIASSLAVDSIGNVYLLSVFRSDDTLSGISVQRGTILAKYDANGSCLWARKIGENIYGIIKFKNNELFISGNAKLDADSFSIGPNSYPVNGITDFYISKFDTAANLIWANKYGSDNSEYVASIDVDKNNNIIVTGNYTDSTIIGNDTLRGLKLFAVKVNSSGSIVWTRNFGSSSNTAISFDVTVDLNDDIYICGLSIDTFYIANNPITKGSFIVKFSKSGVYTGVSQLDATFSRIDCDDLGRIITCGSFGSSITTASGTITPIGQTDSFVGMCDAITGGEELEIHKQNNLEIFANPTNGICNINVPQDLLNGNYHLSLKLYDTVGNLLQSEEITPQTESLQLNLEHEAKGIYLVTLTDGKKIYSGRVVFL
jgi:hypothetical protein